MQQRVGPFFVDQELARGGQGVVLRARDARTNAPVALKLLLDPQDEVALRRFEREARALRGLRHPSLVRVVEHGLDRGRPYLAMELIEGQDLAERLTRGGPPPPAWTARALAGVARALAACHARGVVHRDVKPQNILIERGTERPVLVDFGLVGRDPGRSSLDGRSARLTLTGEVMGTPSFMAPEQADGGAAFGPVGPAADVHALGATLYALLTGTPPFTGTSAIAVLSQVLERVPPPPRALAPDVPRELDALCVAALAKRSADRPGMAAFAEALEAVALGAGPRPHQRRARRGRALLVSGAALLAGAALSVVLGPGEASRDAPEIAPATPLAPVTTGTPLAAVAPGPPLPDGWREVWRLSDGEPAEQEAPALWTSRATAAPLERVQADPSALLAAFLGPASRRAGGRVAVRYDASALRAHRSPGYVLTTPADPTDLLTRGPEGGIRVRAANNTGISQVLVGAARWEAPSVRLTLREVAPVDMRSFYLGFRGIAAPRFIGVASVGRRGVLEVADHLELSAPLALGPTPTTLQLAPWAPPGQRVVVGGAPLTALDGVGEVALGVREVALEVLASEVDVELGGLELEGVPRRVDRPALASAPGAGEGPEALIVGAFTRGASSVAGPVLALGEATVELTGGHVLLRSGPDVLAAAELAAPIDAPGWLLLERRPGLLRAEVEVAGARASLSAADPFGASGGRPGFGSSGPRVRWADVSVAVGPARAAPAAVVAWRSAARSLARLSSPTRCDPRLAGGAPALLAARSSIARAALGELEAAAPALEPRLRADALARALVASVLAGDTPRAQETLMRLRAEPGVDAAALIDGLARRPDGGPLMLEWLATGWQPADRPGRDDVRQSALELGLELCPTRREVIALELGTDRAFLRRFDEGLAWFDRALVEGAAPELVEQGRGDCLNGLGRHEEALQAWDVVVRAKPHDYWGWAGRARSLAGLGRRDAAIEAAIGAVAATPGAPRTRALLADLLRGAPASPLSLLGRALLGEGVARDAERLRAGAAGRDADVLAYLLGEPPPPGERPTRLLALARRGDLAARAGLDEAGQVDALVRHLARLDPSLRR